MTSTELRDGALGQRLHHRGDIQGLRAYAVIAVMLFHAELPFPGGFTGVDVFFVISGFVITGMLVREHEQCGRIDLVSFYRRRVRRLIPALAVLVTIVAVLASLLLSPFGIQQLTARTGIGSMAFVGNAVIAASSANYFDLAAASNPLLNLWSLSVEEQFYAFFPAFLIVSILLARRLRAGWIVAALLIAVSVASFATTLVTKPSDFVSYLVLGFFSPVTRVWEFGVGAILAVVLTHQRFAIGLTARSIAALIGAAMLLASLFAISETTPFPGPWTLLPVAGAALLILAGTGERQPRISRALAAGPFQVIGDRSYSLYLWHWPFVVIAVALLPLSPHIAAPFAVCLSVLPALGSYRFVEQRFRSVRPGSRLTGARFAVVVFGVPVLACLLVLVAANRIWVPLYESGRLGMAFPQTIGARDLEQAEEGLFPCRDSAVAAASYVSDGRLNCFESQPQGPVSVAVLGDSHAAALYPGVAAALPHRNVGLFFSPGQPDASDASFAAFYRSLLDNPAVTDVIVASWWGGRGVPREALARDLRSLVDAGKRVTVLADLPSFPMDPVVCKYRIAPAIPARLCEIPAAPFKASSADSSAALATVAAEVPGVRLVDVSALMCSEEACSMASTDALLFRDGHHLNREGARQAAQAMLDQAPIG